MSAAPGARLVDAALEASVVGSFTSIGYHARRRLYRWQAVGSLRLDGKVAVVTGGTSGIGRAAAARMALNGARVCVVGRDAGRTDEARAQLEAETGGQIEAELADLSLRADTAALAARLAERHEHIDVLVLNAGALLHDHTTTTEGNEVTLATHVLMPFLLLNALRPQLEAAGAGRAVFVSSGGMYTQPLDVAGLDPPPADYNGSKAYARCKRAQVALAEEWTRRFGAEPVAVNAMHPGWAATRALREALPGFNRALRPILRTPEQGADTIVWLAAAAEAQGGGGFYLDRRARAKHRLKSTRRPDEQQEAARLWELCVARSVRT